MFGEKNFSQQMNIYLPNRTVLCIVLYNLHHIVFPAGLSVNSDLNVSECLIADLKKNKQILYPGKGGTCRYSFKEPHCLTLPICSTVNLTCFGENLKIILHALYASS